MCGSSLTKLSQKQSPYRGYLYLAAAPFLVGTGVEAASFLSHFPVFLGQGLRYGVGALILLPFSYKKLSTLRGLGVRNWFMILALSATGLYGFSVSLVEATKSSSAAAVGVVIGCAPLLIVLISEAILIRLPAVQTLLGALIVVGATALVEGSGTGSAKGFLWSLVALVCDALYSVLSAPLVAKTGAVSLAFTTNLMAATALVITQLVSLKPFNFVDTPTPYLSILYMGVFVSAAAFLLWYGGLSKIPVQVAGLFVGLIPIGALVAQAVVGGRQVTVPQVVGSVGVMMGIALGVAPGEVVKLLLERLGLRKY